METTLPGLYAAGGVGSHGVGTITLVSYDGTVAAAGLRTLKPYTHAPTRRASVGSGGAPHPVWIAKKACERHDAGASIKKRIREIMWEQMGYVKEAPRRCRICTDQLARVRAELLPMGLEMLSKKWNYGWVDALDAEDMLDICEVTIRCAMERREPWPILS